MVQWLALNMVKSKKLDISQLSRRSTQEALLNPEGECLSFKEMGLYQEPYYYAVLCSLAKCGGFPTPSLWDTLNPSINPVARACQNLNWISLIYDRHIYMLKRYLPKDFSWRVAPDMGTEGRKGNDLIKKATLKNSKRIP